MEFFRILPLDRLVYVIFYRQFGNCILAKYKRPSTFIWIVFPDGLSKPGWTRPSGQFSDLEISYELYVPFRPFKTSSETKYF